MQNENENREDMPENKEEAQEYDSFLYKFQQQIIDAWKPVPHTSSNVILYIILSTLPSTKAPSASDWASVSSFPPQLRRKSMCSMTMPAQPPPPILIILWLRHARSPSPSLTLSKPQSTSTTGSKVSTRITGDTSSISATRS
jgi:hypothetical protein